MYVCNGNINKQVTKLNAICMRCNKNAAFSKRLTDEQDIEVIGGNEKYISVCRYVGGSVKYIWLFFFPLKQGLFWWSKFVLNKRLHFHLDLCFFRVKLDLFLGLFPFWEKEMVQLSQNGLLLSKMVHDVHFGTVDQSWPQKRKSTSKNSAKVPIGRLDSLTLSNFGLGGFNQYHEINCF